MADDYKDQIKKELFGELEEALGNRPNEDGGEESKWRRGLKKATKAGKGATQKTARVTRKGAALARRGARFAGGASGAAQKMVKVPGVTAGMMAGADALGQKAQSFARGAEQVADEAERISKAADEVTDKIGEVGDRAEKAAAGRPGVKTGAGKTAAAGAKRASKTSSAAKMARMQKRLDKTLGVVSKVGIAADLIESDSKADFTKRATTLGFKRKILYPVIGKIGLGPAYLAYDALRSAKALSDNMNDQIKNGGGSAPWFFMIAFALVFDFLEIIFAYFGWGVVDWPINLFFIMTLRFFMMGKGNFIGRYIRKRIFITVFELIPGVDILPIWTFAVVWAYFGWRRAMNDLRSNVEELEQTQSELQTELDGMSEADWEGEEGVVDYQEEEIEETVEVETDAGELQAEEEEPAAA